MQRGEIYRVTKPPGDDPKQLRCFVVVSRTALIESRVSTVICAPIYTMHDGLATQVAVGGAEGLKHDSGIHCDALVSIPKSMLTQYAGKLTATKLAEVNQALTLALDIEE
jgi:mRNA interferase MazF